MTAQNHELLDINGEEVSMAFCPPFPTDHPRIITREAYGDYNHSACWRGYQGTWEIKGNRFNLVALQGKYTLTPGEPIFAEWFTGVLRVPRGEEILHVNMGFGSIFQQEQHIRVENGIALRFRLIDNRDREFDRFELMDRNMPGDENRFEGDDWSPANDSQ